MRVKSFLFSVLKIAVWFFKDWRWSMSNSGKQTVSPKNYNNFFFSFVEARVIWHCTQVTRLFPPCRSVSSAWWSSSLLTQHLCLLAHWSHDGAAPGGDTQNQGATSCFCFYQFRARQMWRVTWRTPPPAPNSERLWTCVFSRTHVEMVKYWFKVVLNMYHF